MSDEAPKKKDEGSGAPAWVMTFADLMSLLMCFFVLLLSFSEMDLQKFKQIAGSMKMAFGVQREIDAKEPPRGTSVIAREFSPGRPSPTLMKEIRQNTIDETKQTLEFTDATANQEQTESIEVGEQDDSSETAPIQRDAQSDSTMDESIEQGKDTGEIEKLAELSEQIKQKIQQLLSGVELDDEQKKQVAELEKLASLIDAEVNELLKQQTGADESSEKLNRETEADARILLQAMAEEIKKGMVSIETVGNRIILRIKEKGSFPSGSSDLQGDFMPVIAKLRDSLQQIDGKIVVAGHTDNVPIKTHRFRSNWELSSSRAVTVVHELLQDSELKQQRFTIEGYGESKPLVANDSPENRALNRRVELTIIQNENDEQPAAEVSDVEPDIADAQQETDDPDISSTPSAEDTIIEANGTDSTQVTPSEAIDETDEEIDASLPPLHEITDEMIDDMSIDQTSGPILNNMDQPINNEIEPLVKDPFSNVIAADAVISKDVLEAAPENVTIDAGSLENKLKDILNRVKPNKTEEEATP